MKPQMFSSLRQCAEGMNQTFWFTINVTLKGEMFEPVFYACFISPKFFQVFSLLSSHSSNVQWTETMCIRHELLLLT